MKSFLIILASVLAFNLQANNSLTSDTNNRVDVRWDQYGIAHVKADELSALFYGLGRSQAYNHGKLMLKNYAKANGQLARFVGEKGLVNDIMLHRLGLMHTTDTATYLEDEKIYAALQQFVNGVNDELEQHQDELGEYASLLPITPAHVINLFKYDFFVVFALSGELQTPWPKQQNASNGHSDNGDHHIGSNSYAFSAKKSATGNSLLLMNPHLPWGNEFRWHEKNIYLGDFKASGVGLVGMPGIAIGFSKYGGWTHTVNGADIGDRYELKLVNDGYVVDDKQHSFTTRTFNVGIKQADGTVIEQEFTAKQSIFGPIIKETNDKALALKVAGLDRHGFLSQYMEMLQAKNLTQFKQALQREAIPFMNVVYADRTGNIFYSSNGFYPKRLPQVSYHQASQVFDGTTQKWLWQKHHNFNDYPQLENPNSGWLQNSNDSPWTTTWPQVIKSEQYPSYMAWQEQMSHRNQNAISMVLAHEKVSFHDLATMQQSTKIIAADRLLPPLVTLLKHSNDEQLIKAAEVLEQWDRYSYSESKGAVLFIDWLNAVGFRNIYKSAWDISRPFSTPNGLADPGGAITKMRQTIAKFNELGFALDIAFGDVYKAKSRGKIYPASGFGGHLGPFRVAWYQPQKDGQYIQVGGDSYVAAVEFADQPKAKGLLSYANATFKTDTIKQSQAKLFSEQKWRDIVLKMPDEKQITRQKTYTLK